MFLFVMLVGICCTIQAKQIEASQTQEKVTVETKSLSKKEQTQRFGRHFQKKLQRKQVVPVKVTFNNNGSQPVVFDRSKVNLPYFSHEELLSYLKQVSFIERCLRGAWSIMSDQAFLYLAWVVIGLAICWPIVVVTNGSIILVNSGLFELYPYSILAIGGWSCYQLGKTDDQYHQYQAQVGQKRIVLPGETAEEIFFVKAEDLKNANYSLSLNTGINPDLRFNLNF